MLYLIGIGLALLSITFSVFHLKQTPSTYVDLVAIAVVIGGSVAVSIMTLPFEHWKEIVAGLRGLFTKRESSQKNILIESFALVRAIVNGVSRPQTVLTGLSGDILRDGAELIELGFPSEKIKSILEERIHQASENSQHIANSFRLLAKYPPAFGLLGTVLSLVSVMRAVSTGADAHETGMRMAVALVATLYGLLVANLLISPAGESILKNSVAERKEAEIALQAVLLASERVSLLEAQEMLNSYVPKHDRLSMLRSEQLKASESQVEEAA